MNTQLSIFDELDSQAHIDETFRKAALDAQREVSAQPHQCPHCGEWSPNAYLLRINHGMVFNGWCGKRLMFNTWAKSGTWAETQAEQFRASSEWLTSHGWEPCNEHDPANWTADAPNYRGSAA